MMFTFNLRGGLLLPSGDGLLASPNAISKATAFDFGGGKETWFTPVKRKYFKFNKACHIPRREGRGGEVYMGWGGR